LEDQTMRVLVHLPIAEWRDVADALDQLVAAAVPGVCTGLAAEIRTRVDGYNQNRWTKGEGIPPDDIFR
jgi:hypothetical protein